MSSRKLSHIRDVVATTAPGPVQPPYDDRPIKQDLAQTKARVEVLENKQTNDRNDINANKQQLITMQLEVDKIVGIDNKLTTVEGIANSNATNFAQLQPFLTNRVALRDRDNNFTVKQSGQAPTQDNHFATKKYVDDKVAGGGPVVPPYDDRPIKQEIQQLKDKDQELETKITTNQQSITALQQEDTRLQQELDKTNAKVTTVEQTANNAEQKANDNEQAITDIENEVNLLKPNVNKIPNIETKLNDVENKSNTNEQKITTLENQQQTTNIAINDLGTRVDNLDRDVAKTNQDNEFAGTQTFEFAKVKRVPGNHQHEVINWGVFNTRATNIETRVTALEQRPPGGGGQPPFDPTPLQNEDRRLQGEIDKSNQKITDNQQEITTLKQKDVQHDNKIQQIEQKNNQQDNKIQQIEQKDNQQDSILRNVPRLNAINQFTDTNTFQRLRCKTPAVGDEEVVRQREFNAEVRRLEGLIPPGGGGGGITTNIDNCVVLKYTRNENRQMVQTWNAGAGGFHFARTTRLNFTIPKADLIPVYERLATPQEKAQGQDVQVNIDPVTATFQTTTGVSDFISGVGFSTAPSNSFVNPTGGTVNVVIDRISGLVTNNLSAFNRWTIHITVVISRRN